MRPTRIIRLARAFTCGTVLLAACASGPAPPAPGFSTLAGRVALVAPSAAAGGADSDAYGDRRMRNVERVDYSRPGFAVVHLDRIDGDAARGTDSTERPVSLRIVDGRAEPRIEPIDAVVRTASALRIENDTPDVHILSIPSLGVLARIAAGEHLDLDVEAPGPHAVHLLDRPATTALVFASEGPFARVTESGRFVIADLPPGPHVVHVWHPRMPPLSQPVVLRPDVVESVELEVGVQAPGAIR